MKALPLIRDKSGCSGSEEDYSKKNIRTRTDYGDQGGRRMTTSMMIGKKRLVI